jgi:integrase
MAFIKTVSGKKGITYHIDEYINGKRRSKKTPARNMREAREYLSHFQSERSYLKTPTLLMKDIYFSEFSKEYLEFAETRKHEVTLKSDRSSIKIMNVEIGDLTLKEISISVIQKLQTKWSHEGKANKTINNRTVLLSSMLNYAVGQQYIPAVPRAKQLKTDLIRPKYYSIEEVKTILENVEGQLRDIIVVLLNTGLRANELRNLRLEDIDLKNQLVRIEKSKSHKFRTVPINNDLSVLLTHYKKSKTRNQVYLFETIEGKPRNDYYHSFKRLLNRLKIKGDVHQFRHTFATWLMERNANLYEVQHLLGHASVQTTQRYAHIQQKNLFNAVNLLCG